MAFYLLNEFDRDDRRVALSAMNRGLREYVEFMSDTKSGMIDYLETLAKGGHHVAGLIREVRGLRVRSLSEQVASMVS